MAEIPFIDLHPEKIRGTGPETALLACRHFIENSLKRGHRSLRIITGLGMHGDGTPRLRSRVERDVLPAFYSQIASQQYEQGGAVIRLELHGGLAKPDKKHIKKLEKEKQHDSYIAREERLLVAFERYEAAEAYFDEGDLRRCRLKLNQISKEFFPELGQFDADQEALKQALRTVKKQIDALG